MQLKTVVEGVARACTAVAGVALLVMVFANVADATMASLFRRPIAGTFDLVETTLVIVVFLGFPATFLHNGHIAVDVVDHLASPATVRRLKLLALVVSFVFLVFFAWQMTYPALDALKYGERKQELGLPLWTLWVPMIAGIVLSAVALVGVIVAAIRDRGAE